MSILRKIKIAFHNWCLKMEKANRETLGSGRLDCCKLNRTPSGQRRS